MDADDIMKLKKDITILMSKNATLKKDAVFLAKIWQMIRAEGLEIVLEQGDPEGVDFVADRVTAAEQSVERTG